jgi:predicted nucleotidyltransferase
MTEENLIVDVEAEEVIDAPVEPVEPKVSYRERINMERQRATTLNKMLKDYRRKMKNPLTAVKKMSS